MIMTDWFILRYYLFFCHLLPPFVCCSLRFPWLCRVTGCCVVQGTVAHIWEEREMILKFGCSLMRRKLWRSMHQWVTNPSDGPQNHFKLFLSLFTNILLITFLISDWLDKLYSTLANRPFIVIYKSSIVKGIYFPFWEQVVWLVGLVVSVTLTLLKFDLKNYFVFTLFNPMDYERNLHFFIADMHKWYFCSKLFCVLYLI